MINKIKIIILFALLNLLILIAISMRATNESFTNISSEENGNKIKINIKNLHTEPEDKINLYMNGHKIPDKKIRYQNGKLKFRISRKQIESEQNNIESENNQGCNCPSTFNRLPRPCNPLIDDEEILADGNPNCFRGQRCLGFNNSYYCQA